jgi:class 3 adenylate cyclase
VPAAARFCPECAAPLTTKSHAPSLDRRLDTTQHPVAKIRPSETLLDGERKTISALFADIKGSMELMEDLDPEEARNIIDPALQRMMEAVRHYDGFIVQSTGDGIFALFGAPIAHEDHPQRALYAGLRMQQEMKRYAEQLRAEKGLTLLARVGVNTGEVAAAGELSPRLHPRLGQQDLLHAAEARPAGPRGRGGDAGRVAR